MASATLVGVTVDGSSIASTTWIDAATVWHSLQLAYATAALLVSTVSPVTFRTEKASLNSEDPSFLFTAVALVPPPLPPDDGAVVGTVWAFAAPPASASTSTAAMRSPPNRRTRLATSPLRGRGVGDPSRLRRVLPAVDGNGGGDTILLADVAGDGGVDTGLDIDVRLVPLEMAADAPPDHGLEFHGVIDSRAASSSTITGPSSVSTRWWACCAAWCWSATASAAWWTCGCRQWWTCCRC